jgi:integrase/recombinase XerC
MPDELATRISEYIAELQRKSSSSHTVRNYSSDLEQWLAYLTPPGGSAPSPREIELLTLREWMAHLFEQNLEAASIRRKLAAVRSFFKFLLREGVISKNVARLLRTPKAPKTLPRVPTAEQTNHLLDQVPATDFDKSSPERDRLIFELLYGCGLRVSELAGLNLEDFDRSEQWIRVRGKGKKERQVPFGSKAADAIAQYLPKRECKVDEAALLISARGKRMGVRAIYEVVKFYSRMITHDDSIHPHTLRHAYATHLLSSGADLRAIQELLGHAQLSTTQKYTQVSLTDLMAVYDKSHPLAIKK